jgi:hypothetical protein
MGVAMFVLGLVAVFAIGPVFLNASDHDDGETELKGRHLNLTDLYVFREGDQTGNPSQNSRLIFIMNTNPRSVARQQYYFSTRARYEFKIERAASPTTPPTAGGLEKPDVVLRFEFGEPTPARQQSIKVTAIRDGVRMVASGGVTTPLTAASPIINNVSLGGSTLRVFAGLREDPFYFDVERFFRVRAGFAGFGPKVLFRNPGLDFTAGYNVNSIVVRVPIAFIQGATSHTTFDVWETIAVRTNDDQDKVEGDFVQVERLARPAINEGLILTNEFLNRLNRVGPACEARALAGEKPCASRLGPVFAEAIATLKALGNNSAQVAGIVGAFIPDVMRINTAIASGYANGATFDAAGNITSSPKGGRKILDDVIDITLGVLVPGGFPTGPPIPNVESDNVSYNGPNLGGSMHRPLLPGFPYLVAPN